MQQLRAEMTGTINSRVDMLSSVDTALQNIAAKPGDSKPYRISDLIPRKLGRTTMRKANFEVSFQICTCGCRRGRTKVK